MMTGLQGLLALLGWEPAQATARAATEVLSQEPLQVVFQEMEPMLVMQPTLLQKPVADVGFLNGGSQMLKARGSRHSRVWVFLPRNFFLILGLEIAYYGATFQPCNLHTQYTVNKL